MERNSSQESFNTIHAKEQSSIVLSTSSVQFFCPKCRVGPEDIKFIRRSYGYIEREYSLILNDNGDVEAYDEKEDCEGVEIISEKGYCLACGFEWDIETDD